MEKLQYQVYKEKVLMAAFAEKLAAIDYAETRGFKFVDLEVEKANELAKPIITADVIKNAMANNDIESYDAICIILTHQVRMNGVDQEIIFLKDEKVIGDLTLPNEGVGCELEDRIYDNVIENFGSLDKDVLNSIFSDEVKNTIKIVTPKHQYQRTDEEEYVEVDFESDFSCFEGTDS